MGAARICGTQIFRYLLERDPQINVALLNDPLRSAAMAGSEEMVGLLLRHGANPNTTEMNPARPRYALTPLEAALWGRHLDIARQLIAAGAKPDIFEAAALGEARWLRAFLRKDPQLANLTDRMGLLPIDWACRARQKEAARVLLEYMDSPELSAMIAAGDEHRVRDYLDRVPIVIRTPDERRRYPLNYAIE